MTKITQNFYQTKSKKTIQRFLMLFALVVCTWSANAATKTGTITTTVSSTAVTGTSTLFTTELTVGSIITTNTSPYTVIGTVASIINDTNLTLTANATVANSSVAYNLPITKTSVTGGSSGSPLLWSAPATWQDASLPAGGDIIIVPVGSYVAFDIPTPVTITNTGLCPTTAPTYTYTSAITYGSLTVNGTLDSKPGADLFAKYDAIFTSLTVNVGGIFKVGFTSLSVGTGSTTRTGDTNIYGTIDFRNTTISNPCGTVQTGGKTHNFYGDVTLYKGSSWLCNDGTASNASGNNKYLYGNFTNNATIFQAEYTGAEVRLYGINKTIGGTTPTVFVKTNVQVNARITIAAGATLTNWPIKSDGTSLFGGTTQSLVLSAGSPNGKLINKGTLNVGKNINGWLAGQLDASTTGNTVNFTTVASYAINYTTAGGTPPAFYNMTIGGTGTKTISSGITISGTLSILSSAPPTALTSDITVKYLVLGGVVQPAGSYGGTGTTGSTVNTTYFTATAFKVTSTADNLTIWNGTAWSNGTPDVTKEVLIDGTYNDIAFAAKNLTVNSGKSLTITSGNLTVTDEIFNSGTIVLENNANLIQTNAAAVNTGAVTVKRNSSPLKRLDYTLWSSPVASQNLLAFSPATIATRFYIYDTPTSLYNAVASPSTTSFTAGEGYLIRMPDTAPATDYNAGTGTLAYPGVFTGVPNNGTITFPINASGSNRYNLVGNPYPSPISMSQFVTDNTADIQPTLYFWRRTNAEALSSAYCTWNGGTFVSNGNTLVVDPAGIIQTGQGFFVENKNAAPDIVTFNNGQRVANTSGQFFKTRQVADNNRIWLNATNSAGAFSQMAINYTTNATLGLDDFDAKYINDSAFALNSNINSGEYTIQGRPAFDATDVVALNFKAITAGDYTIAIDHTDGLFANGQDVYLVDSKTGTETNLKSSSYTFAAVAGADNARFSLKYQKTLKVFDPIFNDNSVTVYKNNGTLYVKTNVSSINNIKVFDIQGRLVAEQKSVNASTASINNLKATHQALIVQVTSDDNKIVNKKVVN